MYSTSVKGGGGRGAGFWGHGPPENFAKLKHLWCVFHDFQLVNLKC